MPHTILKESRIPHIVLRQELGRRDHGPTQSSSKLTDGRQRQLQSGSKSQGAQEGVQLRLWGYWLLFGADFVQRANPDVGGQAT